MRVKYNQIAYSQLHPALKFLLISGSTIGLIVSSAPWVAGVQAIVVAAATGFAPVKMVADFLGYLIPWIGPHIGGLWLLAFDHIGAWGTVALYALINAMEIGLIGGPYHCAIAYLIDGLVSLQTIVIYGDGLPMLIDNLTHMSLDPDLFDFGSVIKLALSMFGSDAIWWIARSYRSAWASSPTTPASSERGRSPLASSEWPIYPRWDFWYWRSRPGVVPTMPTITISSTRDYYQRLPRLLHSCPIALSCPPSMCLPSRFRSHHHL
jgi:hypothetical protein